MTSKSGQEPESCEQARSGWLSCWSSIASDQSFEVMSFCVCGMVPYPQPRSFDDLFVSSIERKKSVEHFGLYRGVYPLLE